MLHYDFISAWLRSHTNSDRGASLVEYALLLAFIAIVCVSAMTILGEQTSKPFSSLGSQLGS